MLGVHVHVLDSVTKQPCPVRLRISGPRGEHYVPFGNVAVFPGGRGEDVGGHLRFGNKLYYSIDGRCEVKLPAGVPLTIEVFKGFEFKPLNANITLGAGQISIRLMIERCMNSAIRDWISADARAHFLSPHAALYEAAAEDISITNVLALEHHYLGIDGNSYQVNSNLIAFSGQLSAASAHEHTVFVNTLNVHPVLGKLGLLNCHRPVFPLVFGETDDWSLLDWCRQCHRKGGLVAWVDPFQGGEALVAAILGKVDAIEVAANAKPWLPLWYKLLNCGIRLPLVGGSGKDSNATPLGAMRTYAQVPEQTYAGWIEAVRGGKSYVTNGPILELHREGSNVAAQALSVVPFDTLELIADGDVIASASPSEKESVFSVSFEKEVAPEDYTWLALRCTGKPSTLLPPMPVFAHTSPVYGSAPLRRFDSKPFREMVNCTIEWCRERAQYSDEKWRQQLLGNCDEALARLTDQGMPV